MEREVKTMTLAEFVDKLAKEGTIDGNIAELIMSYHRKESKVPCAAIRDALMPIVGEMDEYHEKVSVTTLSPSDKFWDTHEPQTICDFSDKIADAVDNLCGEIAATKIRIGARLTIAGIVKGAIDFIFSKAKPTSGYCANAATSGYCANAATSGDYANAEVKGKDAIAAVLGRGCKARGALGCWLVLTERDDYRNILGVQAVKVDGESIKADTWYELRGGKVVEAKKED